MSEVKMPWGEQNVFDWYFSEECTQTVGIPFGKNKALEVIGGLASCYQRVEDGDYETAKADLISLAKFLILLGSKREDLLPVLEAEFLLRKFDKNFDSFIQGLENPNNE